MNAQNPFRKGEEAQLQYEIDVVIDEMGDASGVGGGVANFLTGYAIYKGERFPFEAVAYGRIGGQNVSPTLQPDAINRLEELGVDLEHCRGNVSTRIDASKNGQTRRSEPLSPNARN